MENLIPEKRKKIILYAIFGLVAFLILFHYTDTPMPWVDEGVYTETARNIALHGVVGMQETPEHFFSMRNFLLSSSYPVIFPVAGSIYLFGSGIWQSRLPMVIYMFLLVVSFYLFVRKRYGFNNALMSLGLLLSFSPFYGNGRPVQGEVPGLFFMTLGAWFSLFWEETDFKNKKWAFLSGLAFGLAASTKPIYLAVFSIALVISCIVHIKRFKDKKVLSLFGFGFLLPVCIWMCIHVPTIETLRKFIFTSIYLAGNHGTSIPLSQTIVINSLKFVTESTPILCLFLFAVTVFSFAWRFIKEGKNSFSLSESVIFSFILLNLLAYIPGTGWYRYFFPAHAMLYLLFPYALFSLVRIWDKPIFKKVLYSLVLLLMLFQFIHLVFYSDTNFVSTRTRSAELESVLTDIPSSKTVFFEGASEAIIFLQTDNYSQHFGMGDFFEVGTTSPIEKHTEDFLLFKGHYVDTGCYTRQPVSRYDFFTRIKNCKNK